MGDFSGTEKDRKEKQLHKKEALAKYLYDMSKICFASVFLVSVFELLKSNQEFEWSNPLIVVSIMGLAFGIGLAYVANTILKY